jgi:hypothetical protein
MNVVVVAAAEFSWRPAGRSCWPWWLREHDDQLRQPQAFAIDALLIDRGWAELVVRGCYREHLDHGENTDAGSPWQRRG